MNTDARKVQGAVSSLYGNSHGVPPESRFKAVGAKARGCGRSEAPRDCKVVSYYSLNLYILEWDLWAPGREAELKALDTCGGLGDGVAVTAPGDLIPHGRRMSLCWRIQYSTLLVEVLVL